MKYIVDAMCADELEFADYGEGRKHADESREEVYPVAAVVIWLPSEVMIIS